MIYITQLIFVQKGKESTFHAFEDRAIPLMEKYKGKVLHRIRPTKENFIDSDQAELPYEIHFISFQSEQDLQDFLHDDQRLEFMHLKEASVRSTFLVKGSKM